MADEKWHAWVEQRCAAAEDTASFTEEIGYGLALHDLRPFIEAALEAAQIVDMPEASTGDTNVRLEALLASARALGLEL